MNERPLALPQRSSNAIRLAEVEQRTREYIADHLASSTKRAYATDYDRFVGYCNVVGYEPMPAAPECVAVHLASMADSGYSVGSIRRAMSGIAKAHEMAGHPSPSKHPAVKYAMKGIARRLGERPAQVDAVTPEALRAMVDAALNRDGSKPGKASTRGVRNAAMLAFGFAGAFRRSELVALRRSDIELTEDGLRVLIRRSKTDQTGKGREVGIPYAANRDHCPVVLTLAWLRICDAALDVMNTSEGEDYWLWGSVSRDGKRALPLRAISDRAVARTVQAAARAAGVPGRFAGHSLRAGLVTAAARAGKAPHVIQGQTGHKSIDMIMRYIRREGLFKENAASGIGL